MKTIIFYTNFYPNIHACIHTCITCNIVSKFSRKAQVCSYNIIILYKNNHFLTQILSKFILKCIIFVACFQNFLMKIQLLHSKRACKITSFYMKMVIFGNILRQKLDQNLHQNAPFFKFFSKEHTPEPL